MNFTKMQKQRLYRRFKHTSSTSVVCPIWPTTVVEYGCPICAPHIWNCRSFVEQQLSRSLYCTLIMELKVCVDHWAVWFAVQGLCLEVSVRYVDTILSRSDDMAALLVAFCFSKGSLTFFITFPICCKDILNYHLMYAERVMNMEHSWNYAKRVLCCK